MMTEENQKIVNKVYRGKRLSLSDCQKIDRALSGKVMDNMVAALSEYVRTEGDYNLGSFLCGYLDMSDGDAYTTGLKPLPACPVCGGGASFHSDSTERKLIIQCTACSRVGVLWES